MNVPPPAPQKPSATDATLNPRICQSYHSFALRFLQAYLASANSGENVLLSPAGAMMALHMVTEGCTPEARPELMQALDLAWGNEAEVRESALALKRQLEVLSNEVTVLTANSLWGGGNVEIAAQYKDLCEKYFEADVSPFATQSQVDDWCCQRTRNLIPTCPVELTADRALILNVAYFKALWQQPFKDYATKPGKFRTLEHGRTMTCSFMTEVRTVGHYRDDSMQIVELPYKGNRLSFIAIKAHNDDIFDLMMRMPAEGWTGLRRLLKPTEVILKLPRFKFSSRVLLDSILQSMGLGLLYEAPGVLGSIKINGVPAKIGKALQQGLIENNEKGTEAVVLTAFGAPTGAMAPQYIDAIFDSPFFFMIMDRPLNVPLFAGFVTRPDETAEPIDEWQPSQEINKDWWKGPQQSGW